MSDFIFKLKSRYFLTIGVFAVFALVIILYSALRMSFTQPITIETTKLIKIEKGDSLYSVCNDLIGNNYINDCFGVKVFSKFNSQLTKLHTGVYALNPNLSLNEFIVHLNEGKEQQFAVTLLEGDNIYQVLEKLQSKPFLVNDIASDNLSQIAKKLTLDVFTPEGWLYPDTYYYSAYTTVTALLTRAVEKQKQTLDTLWQQKQSDLPITSPYEALILASIVEKESAVAAERDVIASVFHNRLNKKMRLQTDPTVIYGIWHEYNGDIKRKHLKQKTAYNTYRINGLPPTPIANPRRAAIHAVLHPATTNYYYFVASGDGGHVFNTTLAEHNKSVQAYLKKTRSKS